MFLILGLLALPVAPARAQYSADDRVKALFVYKLAKFIEWPGGVSGEPLSIGVAGSQFLGAALEEAVKGKTINGRAIVVKQLSGVQGVRDCQMVVISAVDRKRLLCILEAVRGASVLTVSDMDAFSSLGGVIQFKNTGTKVHFVVNLGAAGRAGLKISSKLLGLSEIIRSGGD